MPKSYDFEHAPGYLIRRAHQVAVAIFMEETGEHEVTPVQFAILNALMVAPGEDQVTLATKVAFDAATFGSVIGRLEARGWVWREPDPADRRRKRLWVTPAGRAGGPADEAGGGPGAAAHPRCRCSRRSARRCSPCSPSSCVGTNRSAEPGGIVLHGLIDFARARRHLARR